MAKYTEDVPCPYCGAPITFGLDDKQGRSIGSATHKAPACESAKVLMNNATMTRLARQASEQHARRKNKQRPSA